MDTEFTGIVGNLMNFTFEQISHEVDIMVTDLIPNDVDEEELEEMLVFLAPARDALVDKLVLDYLS